MKKGNQENRKQEKGRDKTGKGDNWVVSAPSVLAGLKAVEGKSLREVIHNGAHTHTE